SSTGVVMRAIVFEGSRGFRPCTRVFRHQSLVDVSSEGRRMTIVPGEPHPERSESASLVSPKWTRMRFVRCEACGAKALVAASGCPHCGTSLGLRDSRGEPLALAHCPTCDLYYPRKLGECRWCGTEAP